MPQCNRIAIIAGGIYSKQNGFNVWMINFYWLASEYYRKDTEKTSWDKLVWSCILPHFTEKGIVSFKEHFGVEYFESLGETDGNEVFVGVGF